MENVCNKRKIARILIEATVPMAIGNGEAGIITVSEVAVDYNGLPYIPGTSLAGVLRNASKELDKISDIFGTVSDKQAFGSKLIVSDAKIVDFNGVVVDALSKPSEELLKFYKDCPVRQHVKINSEGVAESSGKFDNQVVYKGTRFCFDLSCIITTSKDEALFNEVLKIVNSGNLRIGSGTRKGYGKFEVISAWTVLFDLNNDNERNRFLDYSTLLSIDSETLKEWKQYSSTKTDNSECRKEFKIAPDDFIFFGSGFGNKNADDVPVFEKFLEWTDKGKADQKMGIVIPASSVKGAFANRFEYWYNALILNQGNGIDTQKGKEAKNILFGYVNGQEQVPGLIFIDDIIEDCTIKSKVFNHVKIDRFTGGAFPGALYNEEAIYSKGTSFTFSISIDKQSLESRCKNTDHQSDKILKAVDLVVRDLKEGLLPLGGLSNRGHGNFKESPDVSQN